MREQANVPSEVEKLAKQVHWSAGTRARHLDPACRLWTWNGSPPARRERCRALAETMIHTLLED